MNRTDLGTCQHCDRCFRNHRHIENNAITFFDIKLISKHIGGLIDFIIEFTIGQYSLVTIVSFKDNRCFVFLGRKMPADTLIGNIKLATFKPFIERGIIFIEHSVKWLEPIYFFICKFCPETFIIIIGFCRQGIVLIHIFDRCIF